MRTGSGTHWCKFCKKNRYCRVEVYDWSAYCFIVCNTCKNTLGAY